MHQVGHGNNALPSYPRVLVICGEPFNRKTATGITMSNLFRGWPPDRIAQIYSSSMRPDTSVCSVFWKLSAYDQRFVGPVIRFLTSGRSETATDSGSSNDPGRDTPSSWAVTGAMRRAAVLLDVAPYQLPREVREAVEKFRPEVIYSLLGSSRIVRLVASLSDQYKIPVVPHFMDDWLTTYTSSKPIPLVTPILRRNLERLTAALLGHCRQGLGISEVMCEEYSRRFGIPFSAVMNPVEFVSSDRPARDVGTTFSLVYVGGLHLGRDVCLQEVATVVSRLRAKSYRVELHVYAPDVDGRIFKNRIGHLNGCYVHSSIGPSEVQSTLTKHDCAVHVESFDDFYSDYTRLSISTKIPQYLAAALPVLAYSPAAAASARYVSDNACGIVVGTATAEGLDLALSRLIESPDLCRDYSMHARHLAQQRHDARMVRLAFARILSVDDRLHARGGA